MINYRLQELQGKAIVFYDGTCGFCQASIQLILKYNKRRNLYFATLEGDVLPQIIPISQLPDPLPDAILFYEQGKLYSASEAALRIAKHLNFPFPLLYKFRFIPLSFRDFIYNLIAKHRYRIAGRYDACLLPSEEQRARFIV